MLPFTFSNDTRYIWQRYPLYLATLPFIFGNDTCYIWQRYPLYLVTLPVIFGDVTHYIWQRYPLYFMKRDSLEGSGHTPMYSPHILHLK